MDIRLRVLGAVTLERDGIAVPLGGPKAQQVLAVLAANLRRPVSTDALMDAVWADDPPTTATGTLQSHISRLRAALAPEMSIARAGEGYVLDVPRDVLDVELFEGLVRTADGAEPRDAAAQLARALQLWRGDAFAPHTESDLVRAEAVRLDELRLVATERWADARLATGDAAALIGDLESLVERHPLRERFWILLMSALHDTGRTAEALRRGNEFRRLLADETGLDVSPALREAELRVLSEDRLPPAAGSRREPSSARLLGSTSFVGRDEEVATLVAALRHNAVVTVTGPGGVGKTRLAMRCAAEAAAEDGREVTVVELATLRDPEAFTSLLARALDVQQRQYRTLDETIVEYLATRRDLLVLDNCEHLTDVVATLVDQLRASCPELRILATSRQPLGLAGELVRVAAPLDLPPAGSNTVDEVSASPAVQLFVARAQSAVGDFELSAGNAADVAEICRRLDGLPLAVELAAARLRALSVRALAERLAQRVQSLGQTQRSADGRLRSLVELVRWSYDLLEPAAQRVFAELAVFAGGFELDAVDAVCTARDDGAVDTVDVLADLVERSMVVLVDRSVPRYRLLEPLREFALDRLVDDGTLAATEARHLDWFLSMAEKGASGLDTAEEAQWSDRLDRNVDNFRAAFQCATRLGDVDRALRLVVALRELCFRRVHYEVASWADVATSIPAAAAHALYPTGLAVRGYGDWVRGDLDAAIRIAHRAVGHADGTGGLAERVLGNAYFYKGDPVHALQWMEKMLSVARSSGNPASLAHALYMRSVANTSLGDTVRGAVLAGEARAAADSAGSLTARAQASYALGLALEGTAPAEALEHLERAAELAASCGNRWVEAFALTEVHWLRARSGEHVAALAGFADVVRTWSRGGDWANQWLSLRRVFGVFVDIGALEAGAVLYGSLAAVGAAHALPFEPADAQRLDGIVDELRSLLGSAAFADAVRRGASMTDTEIVEYVIDRIEQSCVRV